MTRWFVGRGACPNKAPKRVITARDAVWWAGRNGSIITLETLIASGGDHRRTQLLNAAAGRRGAESLEIVDYCLGLGLSINGLGYQSPLHSAASSGNWQTCDLLLRNGADKTLLNTHGKTALEVARSRRVPGDKDVIIRILR
jgi:ankyrin repeat protein